MNKKTRLLSLGVALLFLLLAGCSAMEQNSDPQQTYETAVQNSLEAAVYSYMEKYTEDGKTKSCRVNVQQDLLAEHAQSLRVYALEQVNNSNTKEFWCGISEGSDASAQPKQLYMEILDGKKHMADMQPEAFLRSEEFRPYTLPVKLDDLQQLSWDELHCTSARTRGIVTTLECAIQPAYFEEYEQRHGVPSIFAGSKRVTIEITNARISSIAVYVQDTGAGTGVFSADSERYRLDIIYQGPRFQLPAYDTFSE